ncbi:tRNA (adenosine(37)-N6)-threonylcarbamoyltransferase complex ATPase subunit type 1 TsaE [Candidatus Uhrbacteria bacterium]|nr:tRNA (adenosine(37)-N6)-threonylcarbamoyltransferase complex ATPase subunit type 1 TsaE [Candidatus Uhrbacteria bacterium]
MNVYVTTSSDDMKALAANMLPELIAARVVLLEGVLGSGKTTFAQGVGEALGVQRPLRSPTFTLVNQYPVRHEKVDWLIHADLYRLLHVDGHVLDELGLSEMLARERSLVLVEWPERLLKKIGGLRLRFEVRDSEHIVSVKK